MQQIITDPIKCTVVFVCAGQGKLVHSVSLLSPAPCGIMWSRVMCPSFTQATQPPCPSNFRLSLLAAFPRNGPKWSTPRRFHCSHICQQQTSDNVREQLSFTLLLVIFCCGALLQCLVRLVPNCHYFFQVVNRKNIHQTVLAAVRKRWVKR
jgi:hypothetical protein